MGPGGDRVVYRALCTFKGKKEEERNTTKTFNLRQLKLELSYLILVALAQNFVDDSCQTFLESLVCDFK